MPAVFGGAGALVKREVISHLRQNRSFVVLAALVASACIVTVMLWPSDTILFTGAGQSARALVGGMSAVLLGTSVVVMPALAANSICIERERETFDLLFMTIMPTSAMLAAKLLNTVLFFFLLILAVTPVFGTAFFLVGFETATIIQVMGIVCVTAMTCALIGTAISAWSRRTVRAIVMSYVGVALFMGIGPLVLFFLWILVAALFLDIRAIGQYIQSCVVIGSPLGSMWALWRGNLMPIEFWLGTAYQGGIGLGCLAFAVLGIRKPMDSTPVDTDKPIDDEEELRRRRVSFPFYLIDPMRRKKTIEDKRNPMMVKELRWGLMSRSTTLVRMFYVALIIYFIMGSIAFIDNSYTASVRVITIQLVLTVFVAPALMANSLTKEYELGNMDMLRMTLLRPRDIIVGKVTAGGMSLSPLVAAVMCSTVPLLIITMGAWSLMLNGLLSLLVCCLLCLAIGLVASLLSRRTTIALVLSYAFNAVVFFGLSAVAGAAAWYVLDGMNLNSNWPKGHHREAIASFFSPILAFDLNAMSNSGGFVRQRDLRIEGYGLATNRGALMSPYWLASNALFTALSLSLIAFTVRVFERFRMQDE